MVKTDSPTKRHKKKRKKREGKKRKGDDTFTPSSDLPCDVVFSEAGIKGNAHHRLQILLGAAGRCYDSS